MKKHLGSTVALILGALTLVAGLTQPGSLLVAGPIIIVGALAYRSAKKRHLGEVKNSLVRKGLEGTAIVSIVAAVLLQNDFRRQIATDPVPNLVIPLWAIIAYSIIAFKKPKVASEAPNVNQT
jgi:hypothetical protein